MKRFLLAVGMLGTILAVCANESAPAAVGQDGSNATGTEKVCKVDPKSIIESLKTCRRGDILDLDGISADGVAMMCDFSKSFFYINGFPQNCVYNGKRRDMARR